MTIQNEKCDILTKTQKQLDREKRIIGYEWYFNTFTNF